MSLREKKKQKTAQEFMEAIERILDKKPTSTYLKKKLAEGKPLKLNPTNVEKEAGKAYNSTKHHQTVLDEIERINTLKSDQKKVSAYNTQKQKADIKAKNKEIEKLKSDIKAKNAEIETLKRVNLSLHAHCRELTSALYGKIPQEDKEKLFERVNSVQGENVVPIK